MFNISGQVEKISKKFHNQKNMRKKKNKTKKCETEVKIIKCQQKTI